MSDYADGIVNEAMKHTLVRDEAGQPVITVCVGATVFGQCSAGCSASLGSILQAAPFEVAEAEMRHRLYVAVTRTIEWVSPPLLETLDYDLPCGFDHHGGCQQHGYLDEVRGCPVPVLKGKEIRGLDMAEARKVAQALLDIIEASGNFDAHAGAERMVCILLGDNWNGKLD